MGRIARGGAVACLWLWTSTGALSAAGTADPPRPRLTRTRSNASTTATMRAPWTLSNDFPPAATRTSRRTASISKARSICVSTATMMPARRSPKRRGSTPVCSRPISTRWRSASAKSVTRKVTVSSARCWRKWAKAATRPNGVSSSTSSCWATCSTARKSPRSTSSPRTGRTSKPPLAWFYLNAALEQQHGHDARADAWLQQAGAHYTPVAEQVFADSFAELGWSPRAGSGVDRLAAHRSVRTPPLPSSRGGGVHRGGLPALPVSAPPYRGGSPSRPPRKNPPRRWPSCR